MKVISFCGNNQDMFLDLHGWYVPHPNIIMTSFTELFLEPEFICCHFDSVAKSYVDNELVKIRSLEFKKSFTCNRNSPHRRKRAFLLTHMNNLID